MYRLHKYPGYPGSIIGKYQPDVRPIARGKYKLRHPFGITIRNEKDHEVAVVAYETLVLDLASIPRLAWTASGLTPDGLIRAGAVVHDLLYQNVGMVLNDEGQPILRERLTRKEADRIFLDLMLAAGMKKWRAEMAYYAVRLFGPRW